MAPRGRALILLAVLAANCSALESLTFDEAHSTVPVDASDVLETPISIASSIASKVLEETSEGGEAEETPTVLTTNRPTINTVDDVIDSVLPSTDAPSTSVPVQDISFASSSNNDTVMISSEGSDGSREGLSPGEVYPSSSTDVSLDGSLEQEIPGTETPAPFKDNNSNKENNEMVQSGSGDSSAGSSNVRTTDGSQKVSSTSVPVQDVSFASSSNNDTVMISSEGSDGSREGLSPGEVHPSSSTDVSLDGSLEQEIPGKKTPPPFGDKKKNKKKKHERVQSDSEDSSAGSSNVRTRDEEGLQKLFNHSSSDTGSSGDGSSGMGALLNPGGVSDVNTSSATYYSLGTGSIMAIVGVVAGIMGVLMLFATISRKKYTDDEDESPLPYGYNTEIRSVVRFSPTFMQDDSFMESGYNGTALMVEIPAPHQFDSVSSTSGESVDEVASLPGNRMAGNQCDSMVNVSLRSRVPSVHSFDGDVPRESLRVSALYSTGSSLTSDSSISGSWSSVLASETEHQLSRNTRDTSLSAWSIANLSSVGSSASGASGLHRMTRSSSTLSADIRGSERSHGSTMLSRSRLLNQPDTNRAAATAAAVESNRSNKSTAI